MPSDEHRTSSPEGATKSARSNPLDAVPVPSPDAQTRNDGNGHAQVRMEIPEKPGLKEFLARKLGFRRTVHIRLDEHGSFVWGQMDGERSLAEIEIALRRQFDMSEEDSTLAIIRFTKMLMLRHLIHIELPVPRAGCSAEGAPSP